MTMNYRKLLLIFSIVACVLAGCGSKESTKLKADKTGQQDPKQEVFTSSEKLAKGYSDIYENAQDLNSLELKRQIVEYLGKEGYPAVDYDNQIDMVCHEQVETFCEKAMKNQEAEITLIAVLNDGGFSRYDMQTKNGKIDVVVSNLMWKEGKPQADYYQEFKAHTWKYTDNGYFFVEEYRPPGFDGPPGQVGFRVKPLDETCRELNRKYVMPVGYVTNKLLIMDWNEKTCRGMDFYDLYEIFYYLEHGSEVPYDPAFGGMEYEVPKAEFEHVIKAYLQMDSKIIEENSVYHADSQTYRYRPRGLKDTEMPYEPYPEVTAYEKQSDGTIKLTVNAVWILKGMDRAVTSELVVKPKEDGSFQYVSNKMITTPDSVKPDWYLERLSDEVWDRYYGE